MKNEGKLNTAMTAEAEKVKRGKRALLVFLILVVFVGALSIGGALAYRQEQSNLVQNTIHVQDVTCEVVETFDGEIKEDVMVRNTGTIEAYIRAAVIINWENEDGNIYGSMPTDDAYVIDYNVGDDCPWFMASDGFYYYRYVVDPYDPDAGVNGLTENLINYCERTDVEAPEGYNLSVTILCSAIQADPADAIIDAWDPEGAKFTVGEDGVLSPVPAA